MKTEKTDRMQEFKNPHIASLTALPHSVLDAWYARPKHSAASATRPLTADEHYRLIELVQQRQAFRHHLTPEAFLWDWLDANVEIKSH